jgi:hypothetical protein
MPRLPFFESVAELGVKLGYEISDLRSTHACRGERDHRCRYRGSPLVVRPDMNHEGSLPFFLLIEAFAKLFEDWVGEEVPLRNSQVAYSGWMYKCLP